MKNISLHQNIKQREIKEINSRKNTNNLFIYNIYISLKKKYIYNNLLKTKYLLF